MLLTRQSAYIASFSQRLTSTVDNINLLHPITLDDIPLGYHHHIDATCDPAVRTGTTCTAMSTSLSLPGPLHITYHVRYTYHVSTTAPRFTTSIVLT